MKKYFEELDLFIVGDHKVFLSSVCQSNFYSTIRMMKFKLFIFELVDL